jgi:predicted dehydrogenase
MSHSFDTIDPLMTEYLVTRTMASKSKRGKFARLLADCGLDINESPSQHFACLLRSALVVGLGRECFRTYVPVLRRLGVQHMIGVDPDPTARKRASFPAYSCLADAYRSHTPEVAIIVADPSSHFFALRELLGTNTAVLCEKPILCALDQLESTIDAYNSTGQALRFVNNWSYADQIILLTQLLSSHCSFSDGESRFNIELNRLPSARDAWRASSAAGALIWDYGWHWIYLTHRLAVAMGVPASAPWPCSLFEHSNTMLKVRVKANNFTSCLRISLDAQAGRRTNIAYQGLDDKMSLMFDDASILLRFGPSRKELRFFPGLSAPTARRRWFMRMCLEGLFSERVVRQSQREALTCAATLKGLEDA